MASHHSSLSFPIPPFRRELHHGDTGPDVLILQLLLSRFVDWKKKQQQLVLGTCKKSIVSLSSLEHSKLSTDKEVFYITTIEKEETRLEMNGIMNDATEQVLQEFVFQQEELHHVMKETFHDEKIVNFTPEMAQHLLKLYMYDEYQEEFIDWKEFHENGSLLLLTCLPSPYLFYLYIPVMENRTIETECMLFDARGELKFKFRGRTKGKIELNQLTTYGDTPTGLYTCDLNSPFQDVKSFGPYNVVRLIQGLKGNALHIYPSIRCGILIHTGEWECNDPMPNSLGCIHVTPQDGQQLAHILEHELRVQVHENLCGKMPYPFPVQGLVSVVQQKLIQ
ncbi:hypothetical protein C9374_012961 [Naegleria lovaniensis]|uniref:YkuD domain-containing protein n=1 Tax=Naegleria lovaniensis TaxID=51637 RepID=A0AA88GDV9_NAELO|nr:uncharacterized protein C9374_012961 [Naegleria lovaniensis]KAG2373018.1 hypothetical protein C9374_012961 [Naegleria lovaniensis]